MLRQDGEKELQGEISQTAGLALTGNWSTVTVEVLKRTHRERESGASALSE